MRGEEELGKKKRGGEIANGVEKEELIHRFEYVIGREKEGEGVSLAGARPFEYWKPIQKYTVVERVSRWKFIHATLFLHSPSRVHHTLNFSSFGNTWKRYNS